MTGGSDTSRQQERVVALRAGGTSLRAIAGACGIALSTVQAILAERAKAGCSTNLTRAGSGGPPLTDRWHPRL